MFVNNALLNVRGRNGDSLLREFFIYVTRDMDVEIESFNQVVHHILRTRWTPYSQRRPASARPAGQENIRHRKNVIRVQVSEEDLIDLLCPGPGFGQTDHCGSTAIEQQLLPASLDQDGWTVSLRVGCWTGSGAKNHNFQSRIQW